MNYATLSTLIQQYTENYEASFVANIPVFVQQAEQRIYNNIQFPSLRKNVTGLTTNNNKYVSCPLDFLAVYSLAVVDGLGNYEYLLNKDVNFIRQAYPNTSIANNGLPKYYALFGPTTTNTLPPAITNELSFILGPTPDASYTVELHYFYYPPTIVPGIVTQLGDYAATTEFNGVFTVALDGTNGNGSGLTVNVTVVDQAPTLIQIVSGGSGYAVGDLVYTTNLYPVSLSTTVLAVSPTSGRSWLGDNFDSVLLYGSLVEAYAYMKGDPDIAAGYNQKYMEALALAKRLGDGMERGDAYRDGQVKLPVN